MKLTLPARSHGQPISLDTDKMTIVGANGAGKTRFSRALAAALGPAAFCQSALKGLYSCEEDSREGSIDSLYRRAVETSALVRPDIVGEFDRLLALLINETMVNLMAERYHGAAATPVTRLDRVMERWEKIFPGNKILVEYGKLLIDSDKGDDAYSTRRLSAGEKAVMYHLGASLMAPQGAAVFVDSPEMFLHASVVRPLWDSIESMRPDCTFIYITHDLGFAATRRDCDTIWVKACDAVGQKWDYERLAAADGLPDEVYLAILGERKPVMFIEGDGTNSFDAKLYPLIFPEFTVKPLGSCDRVIEATRSFNGLRSIHNLDAYGIVDRDRRDEGEVAYLRTRKVMVPEVAEIENLFMIEDVFKTMAARNGRRPDQAFGKLRRNLLHLFEGQLRRQALEHTRHRLKKDVAHRVDGRFDNIAGLERHISELMLTINPRGIYNKKVGEFRRYLESGDYAGVLRVFNHKSMLTECRAAELSGVRGTDSRAYARAVLDVLRLGGHDAEAIRLAIRRTFKM